MYRFSHTFAVDPRFVLVPVASRPIFTDVMANAMAHLGISSSKWELTIASDGTPMLSMKFIRDVARVSAYLYNNDPERKKSRAKKPRAKKVKSGSARP